jgi:hypothetical protein
MQNENRTDTASERETKAFSFYRNRGEILADSEQDVVAISVNINEVDFDEWNPEHKGEKFYYWVANPTPNTRRFEYNLGMPYKRIFCGLPSPEMWEGIDEIVYQDSPRRIGSAIHLPLVGSTLVRTLYAGEVRKVSPTDIEKQILEIFQSGEGENFEDGIESDFSRALLSYVRRYGNGGVNEIAHIVLHGEFHDEAVGEAILCLARLDDCTTYKYRRWLMEKALESEGLYIRDAAITGLSHLDDKESMPAIEKAVSTEKNIELRKDMEKVLSQLRCL